MEGVGWEESSDCINGCGHACKTQSLSFCAETLSAKIEQKQECVLLLYLFIIPTIWNLRILLTSHNIV